MDVAAIRAVIARGKRWDLVFAILGVVCLAIGLLTVLALAADMALKGWERISPEFFTSYPSRRAANAGILSAWIGSTLVMLVTADRIPALAARREGYEVKNSGLMRSQPLDRKSVV